MVDIHSFGDHLAQAGGVFEPQRQNNWLFEPMLDSADDSKIIQLSLDSGALPTVSFEEIELNYLNVKRYVAGKVSWDTIPISVKDFVDVGTAQAIVNWWNLVYDPVADTVGFAADYKKVANLILLSPDGTLSRSWQLIGCWPQSVNHGTLDMNANDVVKIEATFRFDKAIPNVASQKL